MKTCKLALHFISVVLFCSLSSAEIQISKKKLKSIELNQAQKLFSSFRSCAPDAPTAVESLFSCSRNFFVKSISETDLKFYTDTLIFPDRYSDLYPCDKSDLETVKQFEETSFDKVYCVRSNISRLMAKRGFVFFAKEGGLLKIAKIKL